MFGLSKKKKKFGRGRRLKSTMIWGLVVGKKKRKKMREKKRIG